MNSLFFYLNAKLIIVSALLLIVSCKEQSFVCPVVEFINPRNIIEAPDVLIAHAGGEIDGYVYTNSLEAMNYSYSKGARLFELDIRLSSDEKLIAYHEDDDLSEMTDDKASYLITEEEFMSLKFYDTYSPMNLQTINDWFTEHEDAVLVTDKINTPKELLNMLTFPNAKDRLMMELFTWEAVEEAANEGINVMVNHTLIWDEPNVKEKLSCFNIGYITIPLSIVLDNDNRDFLATIKEKGIKTYVFNLNEDEDSDEQYVYENYMDFIHGMYADEIIDLDSTFP